VKKLVTNIAAVGAADAGARLIGFFTTAYLGRVLGSEGFGLVGIGLAVAGYLYLLASPGIHVTGTRDIAAGSEESGSIVTRVMSFRMLAAPLLLGLAAIAVLAWRPAGTAAATLIVASAAIVPMAFSFDWYFQGKEQFILLSVQKILGALAFLLAAVVLVGGSDDAPAAAGAFVVGTAVASVYSYVAFRRREVLRLSWAPIAWKRMLEGSAPVALSSLFGQTATGFPLLVAGAMLSAQSAGLMNAAVKLVLLALIMDRVFATLFLPSLARAESPSGRARIVRLGVRIMVMLALPVAVGGWVLAPWLMTLVFGGGFEGAVGPFRILLVYLVATLVNTTFVSALIVARRERLYFNIMLVGALVTAAAALVLTPVAGIEGTAASVSLGEVVMTGLFALVLKSAGVLEGGSEIVPVIVAGAGMAAVVGALSMLSLPLAVGGGLGVYTGIVALMKGFTGDDLRLLREVAG
jgi:O-antigen/teichoic acid export membrane protein